MKNKLAAVLVIGVAIAGCGPGGDVNHTPSQEILPLVPQPVSARVMKEKVSFSGGFHLVVGNPEVEKTAEFLRAYLVSKGYEEKSTALPINLTLTQEDSSLRAEGYSLEIDESGIDIVAPDAAGLFYGTQTLMQLAGSYGQELPVVSVIDHPRFKYRGMHLDVGRHMFPAEFIKKYVDLLAHHKMNRFHWHLTEDQGWRIEIRKFPLLQEKAAFRKETVIGHATTATRGNPKDFDGKRYGGYYTQEEIKEIVQYAKDRHVTIVPEIELPGHALAALSAYPGLGCTGGPYEAATTWGVFDDVFCAGKEETFTFLQGVLDEVMVLFPGEYIHIGGDECPKTRWKSCPHCQKRMKEQELQDEHQLQSYFIRRIENYLNDHGRQIIGWDEILEGGLAPNATVMSWRGEEGGIEAATHGHDVVMTPGNWCYFDHYQDSSDTEPLAIGGFTPVREVYSYEPVPASLPEDKVSHILGAQANVWTEYIKTPDHVEYMVYPRACAMAEVVWSPKEARDYQNFEDRLRKHLVRLDERNLNYAKHILKDGKKVSNSGSQ